MKIVEALKRLKVIEKRISRNSQDISKYSSGVNTERPLFETEAKQRAELKSLIQSNLDLLQESMKLKKNIEHTNLSIKVDIEGKEYFLSDLLMLKRKMIKPITATYESMNDNAGEGRLRTAVAFKDQGGSAPHVVRYYDEKEKNEGRRKWMDLGDQIDSRLEVINATTDLVELF